MSAGLRHVLLLGGAPGAGKTTVARRLARRHGLRLYSSDTRTWVHRDRALAAGHRAAQRWEALEPDERWRQDPSDMLAMSLHRDRGEMVLADLRALPPAPLVLAEGSVIPALAVVAGDVAPEQAVWLLPTRQAQRAHLAPRGTTGGQAELHELLREHIAREARDSGVATLLVDGAMDVEAVTAEVEHRFAPLLEAGPVAHTVAERRALLREANLAVVEQVRGFHRRPWASGDPERVVRSFICECGDPRCTAEALAPVRTAARRPVLVR